jgi:hypothetical protein
MTLNTTCSVVNRSPHEHNLGTMHESALRYTDEPMHCVLTTLMLSDERSTMAYAKYDI